MHSAFLKPIQPTRQPGWAEQKNLSPQQILNARKALLLALVANACAHSFFLISFPALARELGLSDLQAGLLMGLSALAMTLSSPLWGMICERKGRRSVFLTGLLLITLILPVIALTLHLRWQLLISPVLCFSALLVLRLLSALGSGAIMPSAQAWTADTTSQANRTSGIARLGAAFGLGSVLGSMLAMSVGIQWIWLGFTLASAFLIAAVLHVRYHFPETLALSHKVPDHTSSSPDTLNVIGRQETPKITDSTENSPEKQSPASKIWPCFLITLLALACYSLVQHVMTLRLQDSFNFTSDLSVRIAGATMTLSMLLMIATQGWLLPRLNWLPGKSLLTGTLIALFSFLLALSPALPAVLIALVSLGIGLGLLLPSNLGLMSLNSPIHQQARNAGINGTFQGLGMASGPIAAASLHQLHPLLPWAMATILMLMILLLYRFVPSPEHMT